MTDIDPTEFWRWACSDFMSNALRGVLAEFIVAKAAGCTHRPRVEWDAYDLTTDNGCKIEVKSAGYIQTWRQSRPSRIQFDIAPKRGWNADTNVMAAHPSRSADLYVFCVMAATEKDAANPLDLNQWFFLVCPTTFLSERLGAQKNAALSTLEALGLERVSYGDLPAKIAEHCHSIAPSKYHPME